MNLNEAGRWYKRQTRFLERRSAVDPRGGRPFQGEETSTQQPYQLSVQEELGMRAQAAILEIAHSGNSEIYGDLLSTYVRFGGLRAIQPRLTGEAIGEFNRADGLLHGMLGKWTNGVARAWQDAEPLRQQNTQVAPPSHELS